jgi:hypothetical protein
MEAGMERRCAIYPLSGVPGTIILRAEAEAITSAAEPVMMISVGASVTTS